MILSNTWKIMALQDLSNMEKDEPQYAYMCKRDWNYHVPYDMRGRNIYFTEKDLIRERECVRTGGCGIVKIEIKFVEVIKETGEEIYEDD